MIYNLFPLVCILVFNIKQQIILKNSLFYSWQRDRWERSQLPLHLGETPTQTTEEQSEQPKAPQRL